MYVRPSDAAASLQLSSQRKRDLLAHFETNVDELDRWRAFLAALKPSYGVGVDFGAETIAKANARHPELYFVLGDVEDPRTLAAIEGPFDYIVIADTIGMFEDIDGTLRLIHKVCAPSTRIIIAFRDSPMCNCTSDFDAEPVIRPRFARTRWHRPGMTDPYLGGNRGDDRNLKSPMRSSFERGIGPCIRWFQLLWIRPAAGGCLPSSSRRNSCSASMPSSSMSRSPPLRSNCTQRRRRSSPSSRST
jgi:hypothetical protein